MRNTGRVVRINKFTVILSAALLAAGILDAAPLVWSKAFAPDTIGPGSTTTLTFSITNNNAVGATDVAFTDNLPAGVVIADPPGVISDCPDAVVTAPAGGSTISVTGGRAPGNGTCTISVNVVGGAPNTYINISEDLTSSEGNSGTASDTLTVSADVPGFRKSFSPTKVGFGGRSTLTFTIDNTQNPNARRTLIFTDTLPAGMVVADPSNATSTCANGSITAVPGSSTISYSPAIFGQDTLDNGTSCTVSVDVIGQSVGFLDNVSGELTTTPTDSTTEETSGKATARLEVVNDPLIITKEFIDDPVAPGATGVIEFTITNRNRDDPAVGITFTDNLGGVLSGLVATGLPKNNVCGSGSQVSGTSNIILTGGSLAPGASCTFTVEYQVPSGATPGVYTNTTSVVAGIVAGQVVQGSAATDTLTVAPIPKLEKVFLNGPAVPGGSATMRFRITNQSPTLTATDISFLDEFPAGLIDAPTLPAAGFCGPSSTITFVPASQFDPPTLIISDAELAPGASCTFDVGVTVAPNASGGIVTNITGPITAMIGGVTYTGDPASADLEVVEAPQLTKVFLDNPVLPGNLTRIQFTLQLGAESPQTATGISFTDDLDTLFPSMIPIGLPKINICGAGSTLTAAGSVITFSGGSLAPGTACSFIVDCLVPTNAPLGTSTNTTSQVSANFGAVSATSSPATADLIVTNLSLTKEFTDDPVVPGGTATLQFTLENLGGPTATSIEFTDDLDNTLDGLVSLTPVQNNICGTGSSLTPTSGGSNLTFQGGTLAGGTSCTFSVTVQVPANADEGGYQNSTSQVSADIGGSTIALPPASDTLEVLKTVIELTKTFLTNPATPGSSPSLEFTLTNLSSTQTVVDIAFTDPLPAGLTMTGGPKSNICGTGSQVSGGTTISFTGGRLGPSASCTFSVPVLIPVTSPLGPLQNTTSDVTGETLAGGLAVCGTAASADLTITSATGPFQISSISRPGDGTTVLDLTLVPGGRYCVQWSDDLDIWNDAPDLLIGTGSPQPWIDTGPPTFPAANGKRYYRLVEKVNP